MAPQEIKLQFLARHNLGGAGLTALPQDASSKSYDRVLSNGNSFILLHYPEHITEFNKFIAISDVLLQHNLIAPKILATDTENRLMLLEDFGQTSLRQHLLSKPALSRQVYKKLIDILQQMQQIKSQALASFAEDHGKENFLKALRTSSKYYFQYLGITDFEEWMEQYLAIWQEILASLPNLGHVFVHRDFHLDNLFLLNDENIGILDYQDCVFSSPIYDLMSLLDDARIDVSSPLRDEMIDYYCASTNFAKADVLLAYNILGAQCNTRILGVFARKALSGNNNYLPMMPRVANYLAQNLQHPALSQLKQWMDDKRLHLGG